MASVDAILGAGASNDEARQLFFWGVLYGLIGAVFAPALNVITEEAWSVMVDDAGSRALPPDLLAAAVVRGWISQDDAAAQAKKSGLDGVNFALMVNNARNPISPEEAVIALRRKIIPETAPPGQASFENAIAEGNTGDQWIETLKQLGTVIPTPADVLQGVLTGQIPAGTDPRALYEQVGGQAADPNTGFDWYTFMFNTRGSAPTPTEAGVMARRGIVPWGDGTSGPVVEGPGAVSFHQAFLEGPWRDKWEPAFKAISVYLPPPRTVVAMLHNGSLTPAQASQLLTDQGLTPDLVAAYVADATRTKTAPVKTLSQSNVMTLLADKLITTDQATTYLEQLGYPADEAATLATTGQAAQTIADAKAAVNRVRTYYIAHKVNRAAAATYLGNLGVDPGRVSALLAGWDVDRTANVRTLTPAQIESAWEYGIMSENEALAELQLLGYTPLDAWTLLSIKAKAALPNKPAGLSALTP